MSLLVPAVPNSAASGSASPKGATMQMSRGDGEEDRGLAPPDGAGGEESAAARAGRQAHLGAHASVFHQLLELLLLVYLRDGGRRDRDLQGGWPSVGPSSLSDRFGEDDARRNRRRDDARRRVRARRGSRGGNTRRVARGCRSSPSTRRLRAQGIVASGSVPSHRFSLERPPDFSSGAEFSGGRRIPRHRRRAFAPPRPPHSLAHVAHAPARRASPSSHVRTPSRSLASSSRSGPTRPPAPPPKPNNRRLFGSPRA